MPEQRENATFPAILRSKITWGGTISSSLASSSSNECVCRYARTHEPPGNSSRMFIGADLFFRVFLLFFFSTIEYWISFLFPEAFSGNRISES
ncbi:hypothetical protein HanRHA438_Chr17g0827781 [Helianthus annuus]|nr:hypothetical protein HanRHA438_Chr17g0827781 [Helianthus annuus]